jgi:hypothetical protein
LRQQNFSQRIENLLKNPSKAPLVPLSFLIRVLVGESEYSRLAVKDQLPKKLERMHVRILQFVQFFVKPRPEKIIEVFQRSAGIVCKVNAKFVDLILPVLVVPEAALPENIFPCKTNMSVCLIQVKCRAGRLSENSLTSVMENLTREACVPGMCGDLNYLSLVLELGHGKHTALQVNGPSFFTGITGKQIPIAVASLRAEHVLDPALENLIGINSAFRSLLRSTYNPSLLSTAKNEARESVISNHPITMRE